MFRKITLYAFFSISDLANLVLPVGYFFKSQISLLTPFFKLLKFAIFIDLLIKAKTKFVFHFFKYNADQEI